MAEETFGVAPGWGRDGLYVGRAANMKVAPSAWWKRSRTTGKTFGAALGATRGSGGSDGLYVGKTENCASRPLRGGSRSAAFPFQPKCPSLCGWKLHPLRGGNVRA